jgi:hypothetical protein
MPVRWDPFGVRIQFERNIPRGMGGRQPDTSGNCTRALCDTGTSGCLSIAFDMSAKFSRFKRQMQNAEL